jgi:hypothetical protein
MSALGWISLARRAPLAAWLRRGLSRKPVQRRLTPRLESLESIDLLSRGALALPALAAETAPVAPASIHVASTMTETTTQTTSAQVVNVPPTLTNFTSPFAPPIQLFNPALGTLSAVHVTVSASLLSEILSQNTSTSSPADITPFINGMYQVTGLPTTVSNTLSLQNPPTVHVDTFAGEPPFTGPSTVVFGTPVPGPPPKAVFPPVTATDLKTLTFTSAADLAFFTASAGRTTITPQLDESAMSGATAPNGNLRTSVTTFGSGQITVTYDYIPTCPMVVKLVRFGIHHQPTTLQLFFEPATTADVVANPAFYTVVKPNHAGSFTGPGVKTIPVTSATFDAATNSVLLTTAKRLNVHHLFQLQVNLPCNNGNIVVIEFGGKKSLGGFFNPHTHRFVPVSNGKVVGPIR